MKEVEEIMEKWDKKDASLTLYVEREKSLNLDLGLEDYWQFLNRFEKNERKDVTEVIKSLLHHGYKCRGVDTDGLCGTVGVFFS